MIPKKAHLRRSDVVDDSRALLAKAMLPPTPRRKIHASVLAKLAAGAPDAS